MTSTPITKYNVDEHGYFGDYGGAYVPELLHANIDELAQRYVEITNDADFKEEYQTLLTTYVGRPTPLYFAKRLSQEYGHRIYLKREDLCHTGSHKINNAIGQALVAKRLGKKRIIAETGAGQHGVATATACALLKMDCVIYMGEVDMKRQAPNVARMRYLGTEVRSAASGSKTLKDATNEAMRDWIANPESTHYIIGSAVGPHPFPDMVARFQSIISDELRSQLKSSYGIECPDALIACVGGGSNAIGTFYHYLSSEQVKLFAVEAAGDGLETDRSAATLALGTDGILHGSKTVVMQTGDGQVLEAHSASAGLDYPGIGPQHAFLKATGRVTYLSATDSEAFAAAKELSLLEGLIPALESAHAFAVFDRLKLAPDSLVVVNLSGRGDKDLDTYFSHEA